ncbi:TrkH family potassium uptake protein [Vulcaniibacterium tengchongense]|uniref:Trk system potassium uptake protein TrkH n=1 Tax=Vulcaniibacterium tengchongense TaxID=1273429 RepID=A0A3N4V936_9GAMM|nr:potassium transporter TrkG [Vulcaniibacterium tengchongense]RPE79472.1 trk system potassium uptake protein TrkH [Vulcaniibacterium tengchongense]
MQRHGIRHPARLVPLAFLGAILLGTALLMLPVAHAGPGAAAPLVALFTAVSAICVTGLSVVDTPVYWSPFGQVVILGLIQVGGFGIMTGATLLGLLVSRRLRLGTRLIAQVETRGLALGDVAAVVRLVVLATVTVELAVAATLALRLHLGYGEPWGAALWHGLFHAVSAFNNAGFSTFSDNLMRFEADALVIVPVMLAIVLGGLGFPVLHELRREPRRWRRWSVHTKITLFGSALLIVAGMLAILAYEWRNPLTLGELTPAARLLGALFHSVSARTAGFNTLDVGAMQPQTLAVHYVLMLIGGGSAGTAGGIKVTTFFLLGFVVWAEVRGSRETTAFRRSISVEAQRQALTVVLLAVGAVALGTLALQTLAAFPLERLLFEAISAFATTGLSTGITAELPPAAQLVLIVLMFVGRVGTITVATALALRGRRADYRYPEERPIVG